MTKSGFAPKGSASLGIAGALVGVSTTQLFNEDPMAQLFGLLSYFGSIALVVNFLWNEITALYEKKERKKKKIILVFSAITVLVFSPLMMGLMWWHCITLYKKEKEIGISEKNELRQKNLKTLFQLYMLAGTIITIGTCLVLYYTYTK